MIKEDKIEIEVLSNGDIKVTTDPISQPNHLAADKFLKFLEELAGGTSTHTKRGKAHTHIHRHEETKA